MHILRTTDARRVMGKFAFRFSRGAVALETALVFPLLVLVVYISLELFLYFLSYAGLNYAAQSAADLASKLQIEIMTDRTTCPDVGAAPEKQKKCEDYLFRVSKILEKVDTLADKFSVRYPARGRVVRLKATHYFDDVQKILGTGAIPACANGGCFSGFMRPGEKLKFENDGLPVDVEHPTRPFTQPAGSTTTLYGWPKLGESWQNILYTDPVVVQIVADYYPLTPYIGPIRMTIRQLSYRKTPPTGRPGRGASPKTPTPTPTPTPVATNLPTATPTPTPTPTPNCLCCPSGCGADFAKCIIPTVQGGCAKPPGS